MDYSIRLFLSLLQLLLCLYQIYLKLLVAAGDIADFRNENSYDDEISKRIPVPNEASRNTEAKSDGNTNDKDVDAVENHF